ncbi:MAG TPA: hypothetical protein VGM32_01715, partial [Rhodopila sp.]
VDVSTRAILPGCIVPRGGAKTETLALVLITANFGLLGRKLRIPTKPPGYTERIPRTVPI